ncbi:putative glucose-6-phosphate dehydrogenase, NAD(P)-binding domain superfamily [Plasmopara halstedii]
MRDCLLLCASLILLGIFHSAALHYHPVTATAPPLSSRFATNGSPDKIVNVIIAGATGDLATKYLWVSMFRLALKSEILSQRTFRFFAGATHSTRQGTARLEKFFNGEFANRVCKGFEEPMSVPQTKCREFLDNKFKQSVQYAPLVTEKHYQTLGRNLVKINDNAIEDGRIVYLAIPPHFFLKSCELIHRYLRPQQLQTEAASFLRIVVEKPFGRDFQSAHELATHLRKIYGKDELYVMDHYAGKPVVHALRDYFQLNAAALHPVWNSEFIDDIHIEMLETATLENRVHYFDSAGIIRDIVVNHLQLLLNIAISPSFDKPLSISKAAQKRHESQLRFIKALRPSWQQNTLFVAKYDEYSSHYDAERSSPCNESDHFTPTAVSIKLRSALKQWRNTTFSFTAAKATNERLLYMNIKFKAGTFSNELARQCTLTVTIQRAHNADCSQSHRIEWSCNVSKIFPDLLPPSGWKFLDTDNDRIITPVKIPMENTAAWELGDEISAYDFLLSEVANGALEHFANLDEVEAAWKLWTPVVNAVENIKHESIGETNDSRLYYSHYPIGTSPWKHYRQTSSTRSQFVKEDL